VSGLDGLLTATGAGRVHGVAVGIVTSNADPSHRGRVKVRLPALSADVESTWAAVLTPMAGPGRGLRLLPEEGDTVLVAFEDGDVNRPFVLGAFWAGSQEPPQGDDPGNDLRLLRSRSGHVVRLDDTAGAERIEIVDSSGDNTITLDTAKNEITVHAAGPVTISADGDLKLTAKGNLTLEGNKVSVTAQQDLALSGSTRTELSSRGALAVKGSTVDIN
jgi:uncharacterized protein involved in type VI secretion and phage assembly